MHQYQILLIVSAVLISVQGASLRSTSRNGPGSVVFIGDSLTSQWKNQGSSVWAANYQDIGINIGVSGYTSTQVIKQIQDGGLNGINSTVAVLMVGGNDLKAMVSGINVAQNIRTIISMIQERIPNVRILLLALLPADVPQIIIDQGKVVNSIISTNDNYATLKKVKYLDMSEKFGTIDGAPFRDLYVEDGVHLTTKGYQVWADTMRSTLELVLSN